ncbi:MAG: DNA cytosine methyltransferase [bacterium]|nr:DNA cytosine methyltransferase [bacterium]
MNELALFAGAGGGILGGVLLGWRTVCAVEYNPYAASVLVARQNDGHLEPFPIWDDVKTFSGGRWRGIVDVVSGGFPCQDISAAGKGAGIDGERSGLWGEMARIIREVRPRYAFVENSPMLTSRGLGVVLGDLAEMGFNARWCVLGARHVGAPHRRDRIWILASHPNRESKPIKSINAEVAELQGVATDAGSKRGRNDSFRQPGCSNTTDADNHGAKGTMADADAIRSHSQFLNQSAKKQTTRGGHVGRASPKNGRCWQAEPDVGRVADGVASRVDRLRCLGNGQVPAVAALAWEILNG